MKLRDFEQHLRRHGCVVLRQGGGHTIYENPASIKTATLRRICKVLDIPIPLTR